MATISKFEDLRIWRDAREVCQWLHQVSINTNLQNDFKLKHQANASSGSIMDNIAEGFERNGNREFIQFLAVAKGSCGEFRSQLYRLYDREYIDNQDFERRYQKLESISKGISSFMNYLKKTDNKGWKFREPLLEYGFTNVQP